ncbi:arginase [Geopsychrobacter electrodiphilus]|uniref:arginase n=1 Tax=Geopsychrobacter electrodiphilus TaxID=225196 RepID=UPI000371D7F7|nr:arginase [Geopsychrobacter electrodiphilus]
MSKPDDKAMKQKIVRIIGIPMDLGQNKRGVDMGPAALRYAGLAERLKRIGLVVQDAGNIMVPVRDAIDSRQKGFVPAIAQVCNAAYLAGSQAVSEGIIPIFMGGDHSIAIGTIGGVTADGAETGVIWVDAHADYNTPESSPSGNVHGMPLAALLGDGPDELISVGRSGLKLKPENVVLIGLRDLDASEKERLKKSGMLLFSMREIDEQGMGKVAAEAIQKLANCTRIHVSLDVDALDPNEAPGVGTPVPGGLSYREAQLLMEIIADSRKLTSLDIVEINPILDQRNRTAEVAVELVASLLGKSIL